MGLMMALSTGEEEFDMPEEVDADVEPEFDFI